MNATIYSSGPKKEPGFCEKEGIEHSWVNGPTLTSNPPIPTRHCVNCGKQERLTPGQWQ